MTRSGVKRPTPRDPETYATIRQWEVTIPPRMTKQWLELVAVLFDRQDISDDWWPTEMVVSALISEVERSGNTEYPGYRYLDSDGVVKTKVLATARWKPIKDAPVFNPQHWRVSLSPTETEIERTPDERLRLIGSAYRYLHEAQELVVAQPDTSNPDDESAIEGSLRGIIDELTDFVEGRYGS